MHRRALLASLAAGATGLAGCTLTDGSSGNQTTDDGTNRTTESVASETETETETTERETDELRTPESRASVVELATGPRTYSLYPTRMHTDDGGRVSLWFERTATADHPTKVRGWFQNGNDYENTFEVRWIPAVGRTRSRNPDGYGYEARLHFAPTENNDLAETVPDVVRDESGYWRVASNDQWMPETVRLEPGEHVELEYVLVGGPEMSGRPTGAYEFRGRDERVDVAVWDTNNPGPEAESRFAGRSVPEFDSDRTVGWYHDADRTTSAFVRPSKERVELDGRVGFEVVNHSHETLQCGHWSLYKLVDGQWFHVAPRGHTSDCRTLVPGEKKQWSLRAFNGEAVPCDHGSFGGSGLTRGYLGGGEYAVVAGYGHPTDASGAVVELVGDSVTLAPTDDASVERDGDTVTVTTGRYGDDEHPPDATFALTRAETADQRVIAEQVMATGRIGGGYTGLRNLLAVASSDVDRVVLRTDEHALHADLREEGATRRVRFRGQAYEITRTDK